MIKLLKFNLKMTVFLSIIASIIFAFLGLVTWFAARETIIFIAPVAVYSMAVFSIFSGLVATITFGWERSNWLGVRKAEGDRDKDIATYDAKLKKVEYDREHSRMIFEAKLLGATVKQVERGLIHPASLGGDKFSSFPTQVINQIEAQLPAQALPDKSLVFEDVAAKALASRGAGRFIAFGGMGSGKTTLAKHTVRLATDIICQQGGKVFIIDPHAPKTVWGDGIEVIGAGMDYTSIRGFLDHVKADVKARYKAGCGDDTRPLPAPFKPNFIICEEWTGVIFALRAMKLWDEDDIRTFYMDARKAGWGYLLVSHEYTTKALGLDRLGNLLSGIEYFITLDKDAVTETYSALLGRSFRDKEPYPLITPGPFYGQMVYTADEAEAEKAKSDKYPTFDDLSFIVAEPEPDEAESKAIEAYESLRGGQMQSSWNTVVKAAYGDNKTGKFYHEKLKKTLDKHGVDYQE